MTLTQPYRVSPDFGLFFPTSEHRHNNTSGINNDKQKGAKVWRRYLIYLYLVSFNGAISPLHYAHLEYQSKRLKCVIRFLI